MLLLETFAAVERFGELPRERPAEWSGAQAAVLLPEETSPVLHIQRVAAIGCPVPVSLFNDSTIQRKPHHAASS